MKIKAIIPVIALLLVPAAALSAGAASKANKGSEKSEYVTPVIRYELSGGAGHYNYAPSFIQDKYGIIYGYMCQNRDPFKIVDYVYLYKGIPTSEGMKWQPGTEVIEPSRTGWDDCHICDPDVRHYTVRDKDGKEHKWIMTYLGVDQWDCNHNQIGLAVADNIEGPWTKYQDVNPLIPYPRFDRWGTGQSTSVILEDGRIAIFYHSSPVGDDNNPAYMGQAFRIMDISDLNHPDIGTEMRMGLPNGNTYVAFSPKRIYAVCERKSPEQDKEIPTWVGDNCIVYYKERTGDLIADLTGPFESWTEVGRVTPAISGFPRNHNPGFLTDEKGWIPDENNLVVYYTNAVTGDDWLWSYDMYSATFPMAEYFKNKSKKK